VAAARWRDTDHPDTARPWSPLAATGPTPWPAGRRHLRLSPSGEITPAGAMRRHMAGFLFRAHRVLLSGNRYLPGGCSTGWLSCQGARPVPTWDLHAGVGFLAAAAWHAAGASFRRGAVAPSARA
jgi:hypothetical protein